MRYGFRHRLHLAVFLLGSTGWLIVSLAITATRFIERPWLEAANLGLSGLLSISFVAMSLESFSRLVVLHDGELHSSAALRRPKRISAVDVARVKRTNAGICIASDSDHVTCSYDLDGLVGLAKWILKLPSDTLDADAASWALEWNEEEEP